MRWTVSAVVKEGECDWCLRFVCGFVMCISFLAQTALIAVDPSGGRDMIITRKNKKTKL